MNANPTTTFPPQVPETIGATRQVLLKVAAEGDAENECLQRSDKRDMDPTQVVVMRGVAQRNLWHTSARPRSVRCQRHSDRQ